MQIDGFAYLVGYAAPQHVRDIIANLGRTEDVRFSPSNRRLAIAEYWKNKISVFDVSFSQSSKAIALSNVAEISSSHLRALHGLDFIDDEKLLVVSRNGQGCIFELPIGAKGGYELTPLSVITSEKISTPGSVAVIRSKARVYEALICNNYAHSVTKHPIDFDDLDRRGSVENGEVLLKKWLDVPDGICVNQEGQWIAVSNHGTHAVLLYKNNPSLNKSSDPDGILQRTNYPHGLRFTPDGRFILVADAGSPYVNIYANHASNWQGVHNPMLSLRVLNNEAFLSGRHGRQEGGPKGIDISNDMNTLVTTCESQPLAFFDLGAILKDASLRAEMSSRRAAESFLHPSNLSFSKRWPRNRQALRYELYRGRIIAAITAALDWTRERVPALSWLLRKIRTLSDRKFAINQHPRPDAI